VREAEQSENWPVQLIIQVKIFISCDTYKISQVTVVAPFDSCLTLPQMTAPKSRRGMKGEKEWAALFVVANLWLQIVLHPDNNKKKVNTRRMSNIF